MNLTEKVNRKLFWKRIVFVGVLGFLYQLVMGIFFGLSMATAFGVLPVLLFQALSFVLQMAVLMVANFALFFGPFLLFARMGKEVYEPGDANWNVQIEDVRGQKAAVAEMRKLLHLFSEGENFVKAGGKRERGALMVGPPGTGKTMLAKAIASELQMPIIIASGASFGGIFFGMDAVAVFMMMRTARKKAKRWGGCVIFIDEIDALASNRGGMGGGMLGGMGGMMGGNSMGLNMLLTQMDGVDSPGFFKKLFRRFVNVSLDGLYVPRGLGRIPALKPPKYNLLFLGATNRPSVLDPAVTRPGRFGRQITFRNPTKESRKDIADFYFSKKRHDSDLDSTERRDDFARITEGHSPAEIEQILSLALTNAFENGRDRFGWSDIRNAIADIESGLAESVEYTERDKLGVARHELGHAIAARFFELDKGVARLSVRMRGGSLGHFLNLDKEEEFLKLRSQMRGRICTCLGSIAAERVFYNENSGGVSGDLLQATAMAASMIGSYGMGPELGLDPETNKRAINLGQYLVSLAEAIQSPMLASYVGGVLTAYRKPVAQILGSAYIDCWQLMNSNKPQIDLAAQKLIQAGELVGNEIDELLDSVNLVPADKTQLPEAVPEFSKDDKS